MKQPEYKLKKCRLYFASYVQKLFPSAPLHQVMDLESQPFLLLSNGYLRPSSVVMDGNPFRFTWPYLLGSKAGMRKDLCQTDRQTNAQSVQTC